MHSVPRKEYTVKPKNELGWRFIYRNHDGALIGRVNAEDKNRWSARYYHNGGGTTFGDYHKMKEAVDFVIEKNFNTAEKDL